ncbi:MAG: transposase, partial [Deltaproteobacteria bacterium]|nr:transposase [Deltaproteobacteria bacterium]
MKQYSTYHIWRNPLYKPILQQHFWKERTFWSDGYFVSSIGQASLSTI